MTLRVEGLQHTYISPTGEARVILHGETWALNDGQHVLVRGVSGSGKTTLFNILAGLLRPTTGKVYFDGQDLYAMSESQRDRFRAQHIGYVFQNHHLIPALTALENVMMPMAFARNGTPRQQRDRAMNLLEQVGLADRAHDLPRRLSTGQRLRVSLARALANAPRLLLADEPTAALDESNTAHVMDLLQSACVQHNAILMVASHDPQLIARFPLLADLRGGALVWQSVTNGEGIPT